MSHHFGIPRSGFIGFFFSDSEVVSAWLRKDNVTKRRLVIRCVFVYRCLPDIRHNDAVLPRRIAGHFRSILITSILECDFPVRKVGLLQAKDVRSSRTPEVLLPKPFCSHILGDFQRDAHKRLFVGDHHTACDLAVCARSQHNRAVRCCRFAAAGSIADRISFGYANFSHGIGNLVTIVLLGQVLPSHRLCVHRCIVRLRRIGERGVLFSGYHICAVIIVGIGRRDCLPCGDLAVSQILGDSLAILSHLIAAFEHQRDRLAQTCRVVLIVPNLGGFDGDLFHSMLVFNRRNTCGALVGGDIENRFAAFSISYSKRIVGFNDLVACRHAGFLPEVLLLLALNILIHAQNHRGPVVVGVEGDGVNGGITGSIGLQACHLYQGASRLAFRRLVAAIQLDRDGLPHAVLVVVVVPDLQHGEAEVLVIVLILDDCGARRGCGINALDRVTSLYQISLVFLPGVGLLFAVDIGGQIAHNRRQRGSQIESGILITVLRACNLCLFAIFFFSERYCDTSIDIVRKQLHDDRSRALTVVVVVVDPFLLDRC